MQYRRVLCLAVSLPLALLCACANGTPGSVPREGEPAVWAVRCVTLRGANHVSMADERAAALRAFPQLNADLVRVVHNEFESTIYYGRYRRKYDPVRNEAEYTPDHLKDIDLIRSLSVKIDGQPTFLFLYATMEELPREQSRHPEWNLARAAGYWSLQVAAFYNEGEVTDRQSLAEQFCAELREQGYEAYYHHGSATSIVTVGLFPKRAVQSFTQRDSWTGAVVAHNRIVDARVLELQKTFTHNLQNGVPMSEIVRNPKTGEVRERVPLASFLVQTPWAEQMERQGRPGR